MTTQKQQVQDHLQRQPNGITSWEAISEYGITRLAAYIGFLKDDGHNVEAVTEKHNNKSFSRYFLVSKAKVASDD